MQTDPLATVRTYLGTNIAMFAMFGARIYAAANLPPGYKPADGPACLFAPRGGGIDYSSTLWIPSLQFRTYALTETAAWDAWGVLYGALNDRQAAGIHYARLEPGTFPVFLNEPGLDWPYILSFFKLHISAR